MQVISGPYGHERVHFEAPPASAVPHEVQRFIDRLAGALSDDGVVAAAIAHLCFVAIQPYMDGNGRMSRALADLVLPRSFPGVTPYVSMTRQISRERDSYYVALESA